jgi:sortase B
MRWRRQAQWLFCIGAVLFVISSGALIGLYLMNAHATPSPNPNSNFFGLERWMDASSDADDGFVTVDWDYWKQINPDIVGWVNIEGTNIDHPIMRAPLDDPTFYLRHDIYRNYSVYGVPYLDVDNIQGDLLTLNAIIYGHHMDDGSMFSDLASYNDEAYAREHTTVCLQTPAGKQRLQVAYTCIIDGDTTEKKTQFADEEAFQMWYEEQRSKACMVLDETYIPAYVVTFCTCSYHQFSNERTLVVCIPEKTALPDFEAEDTAS